LLSEMLFLLLLPKHFFMLSLNFVLVFFFSLHHPLLFDSKFLLLGCVQVFSFILETLLFLFVLLLLQTKTLFFHLSIQLLLDPNTVFLSPLLLQVHFIFIMLSWFDYLSNLASTGRISHHSLDLSSFFIQEYAARNLCRRGKRFEIICKRFN
jgi:hypothetical protein